MLSPINDGLTSLHDINIDPYTYLRRGIELLDSACDKLGQGLIAEGMDELVPGLRRLRDDDEECWRRFIEDECLSHPITLLLRQDPLTARSLLKPRGYADDPVMLDFLFSPHRIPPGTSSTGASIFTYTTDGHAPRSVRARAAMIAETIAGMAERKPLRVLAIMAGHLWEAGHLRLTIDDDASQAFGSSLRSGQVLRLEEPEASAQPSIVNRKSSIVNPLQSSIAKFLAFDQDSRTLAAIEALHGTAITTYQGTLRSLFRGRSVFRNFDLLYSPICDNLADATASRFIATLFGALAPGGRMILSNFAPELVDAGYMEAFMDWHLVYRTEKDLERIGAGLPADQIASSTTYRDPYGNIAFLDITRV